MAKWPLAYGKRFKGLTFAPENTVDAATRCSSAGNAAGELYRIDAGTGSATQIGTLGIDPVTGLPWTISGDMVFLANGGDIRRLSPRCVRARIHRRRAPGTTRCSEIRREGAEAWDAERREGGARGRRQGDRRAPTPPTPSGFGSVFGVVAFKDKVYGFSRRGDFIEIHNDTGWGCLEWSRSDLNFAGGG